VETITRERKSARRQVIWRRALVGALVLAGIVAGAAAPASAGRSGDLWLGERIDGHRTNRVFAQHAPGGPYGWYHIDIWYADTGELYARSGDYHYQGGYWDWWGGPVSGVGGRVLCAQLWYHKPGGGYQSMGLPCHDY
jgi:hypothetical protein